MLSHLLDVGGPRIDERHVLAGLYHMGADIAAHRTRSDNGYLRAHTFLPRIPVKTNASATRYGLMPASWITFAHFGMSTLIRALNSSGGTAEGSYPIAAIFSLRSGDATDARALAVQKIDDLVWRTGGCPDTWRCLLHLTRHTSFFHRRHVGKDRDTLCAGHCKRAQ